MSGYDLNELREILADMCADIMNEFRKIYLFQQNRFNDQLNKGILMSYIRKEFPETTGAGAAKQYRRLIMVMSKFMMERSCSTSYEFTKHFIKSFGRDEKSLIQAVDWLNQWEQKPGYAKIEELGGRFYITVDSDAGFLLDFYKFFRVTASFYDYLSFQWSGLSSGESNLLSMYSRLYSLHEKVEDSESLILMMDEADLSYHPKWQQSYVSNLVHFLNYFYQEKHIQIMIATHSPIVLSDALKGSVVFLNEECLENTFGANIYELYRKGMFLEKAC